MSKELIGSKRAVEVSIAEIIQLVGPNDQETGVLQRVHKNLQLLERMSIAAIVRELKNKRNDFQSTIERVDLSTYIDAKNAAREKYIKVTENKEKEAEAMQTLLADLDQVEKKYANEIKQYREVTTKAEKDARGLITVEIIPISIRLMNNMELQQGDIEILFPIIEQ